MENHDDCRPIPTDSSRITATGYPRFHVSTTPNDHRNARHTIHRQFHHQRFEEFSRGEDTAQKGLVDGEKRGNELDGEERGVYRGVLTVNEGVFDGREVGRVKLPEIQSIVQLLFIHSIAHRYVHRRVSAKERPQDLIHALLHAQILAFQQQTDQFAQTIARFPAGLAQKERTAEGRVQAADPLDDQHARKKGTISGSTFSGRFRASDSPKPKSARICPK